MNLIVIELSGGLGNQLFQYAIGRALAVRNKAELKLDPSFFENYEWHEYSLNPFNIEAKFVSQKETDRLNSLQSDPLNRVKRKFFKVQPVFIKEESLLFKPEYLHIKSPAYLSGHWQSEDYFIDYEDLIRREFQVRIAPSLKNKALLDDIRSRNAVSLHIRRGNFVEVEEVSKVHGTCSMEYYRAAIEHVVSQVSSPEFYIFSDDIPWAKENLRMKHVHHFVDFNTDKTDYEDLRLMYHCRHHIIANSTFSWWGAWLNDRKDKIVVAPKTWFATEERNKESETIVPKSWIRL
jgi:hypothetical protein